MKRINRNFEPERMGEDLIKLNSYMMAALEDDIEKLGEIMRRAVKIASLSYEKFEVSGSHHDEIYKKLNEALISFNIAHKEQQDIKEGIKND